MNVDYNTETQEITVELNTQTIELDTPTGGRGLKGDTGPQGPRGETGPAGVQGPIGETGPAGQDGYDGYSPIVSTSKSGKTTTVTITDADGEKTATILDGEDGQDGASPIITTSKSGKTTTITIVDAEGTKTATILDGEDGASNWGDITGTLSDQTDLQNALDGKAEKSIYGDTTINVGRKANTTVGDYSTAEGKNTEASGYASHAEGNSTTASGNYSHTEGYKTKASSNYQHVSGKYNIEDSNNTYAEIIGNGTISTPSNARTLDWSGNEVLAGSLTINGNKTVATTDAIPTKVSDLTNDTGFITNTVNNLTNYYTSSNTYTKTEVNDLISTVGSLNIEVVQTLPTQDISTSTIYLVPNSSQGTNNYYDEYIYVSNSWELIGSTQVDLSNYYTKTETDNKYALKSLYGDTTINVGRKANTTVGSHSTALGKDNEASGYRSYAEGQGTKSTSYESHAEGLNTTASAQDAHAEGQNTVASGANSHAEGLGARASGEASHAEGYYTKASSDNQHVSGKYNIEDSNGTYAEIIGNGTSDNARSNARTLDWSGNEVLAGSLTINGNQTVATLNDLVNKEEVVLIEGASSNTIPDESDSEAWYEIYPNGMPSIKTETNRQNLLELYNEFSSLGEQNQSIKKDAYIYYRDNQHEYNSYVARLINVNFDYVNQFDYVRYDIVFNFEFIDTHTVTDFGRIQSGRIFKVYCKDLNSSENAICKESKASYSYLTHDYFEDNIQPKLVSGTNIKTINNTSLLGSGNIDIGSGGTSTDVKINGTSITSNNEADIQTEGTYDATTNKIATMADIPAHIGSKVYYGTSSTSASTAAKTVTCSGFTLETGATIFVKFTNANSYNGTATLNVNSTGVKDIATVGDTKTSRYYWKSGEIVGFIYDGTNYVMIEQGNATTTYYGVTKLSNSTSSTSEVLAATPKAVKTAYDLANGKQNAITSTNKLDYSLIDNTPTIPSKTSDLTNDSGFITGYTETDPVFSASAASGITSSDITSWNNKSTFSGNYNDLTNKPTIPDELSDLSDDSTHRLVTDTEKTTWNNKSDFSGSYNDLTNKPTIPTVPTNLSSFTDDLGSSPTHTHSQYLTSFTETDPVFTASAAHGISSSDITNWNGKMDFTSLSSNTRILDLDKGAYETTSQLFIYYYGTTDTTDHRLRVPQGTLIIVGGTSTRKDFIVIANDSYVGYNSTSGGEVNKIIDASSIANNLTTIASGKVLDASQGAALKDQVDANSSTCISNSNKIGTLSNLDTTTQTDLVSAINEVLGDIPKPNAMTLGLSADTNLTATQNYQSVMVPLNNVTNSIGTKLTYDSTNHGIKVGAGVSKIRVSALITKQGTANTTGIQIYANNSFVYSSYSVPRGAGLHQTCLPMGIMNVQENDLLKLSMYFGAAVTETVKAYNGGGTYLTVEVIE